MGYLAFRSKGDFANTEKFLKKMQTKELAKKLRQYGERGVKALAEATPVDTGLTASSWGYKIVINEKKGSLAILWTNSNRATWMRNGKQDSVMVAILLQYGHATRNGGYVQGIDYINPAIKPIFDDILNDIWEEVKEV